MPLIRIDAIEGRSIDAENDTVASVCFYAMRFELRVSECGRSAKFAERLLQLQYGLVICNWHLIVL